MDFDKFINELLAKFKPYLTVNKAYILPDIPAEKLLAIEKTYENKLSKNEKIYWAVDLTLSGKATDSLIVTTYGLYFYQKILGQVDERKVLWGEAESFYYNKKSFVFLKKDGYEVNFDRMHFDVFSKRDTEQIEAIVEFISSIIEFAKLNDGMFPASDKEKLFFDDIYFMLKNDGKIDDIEQNLLMTLRDKYGIDNDRAVYILEKFTNLLLTDNEQTYLNEYKKILEEKGELEDVNRQALDYFREKLGIAKGRAEYLEKMVRKELY